MSELLHHSEQVTSLEQDERWALAQRVAASRHLLKAPQLRDILVYICRQMLAEHAAAISELEIGCKVLGRRLDFNPNEDNIVRVQIRHLRKKLELYFSTEGADEPVILTIPKGGYLPHFEPRPDEPVHNELHGSVESPPSAESFSTTEVSTELPSVRSKRWWVAGLILLLSIVAVLGALLLRERRRVPAPVDPAAAHEDPLWSKFFGPHRQTSVVLADTNFVMVQDIVHADVPLSKYLEGGYPEKLINAVANRELQTALRVIGTRQYTSLGDALLAVKFMELSHRFGGEPSLRYARNMSVRDFKAGNFVLIGSRRGIPWEQLFESQLNFDIEEDPATHAYHLRNKSPQAGERRVYGVSSGGRTDEYTYADLALLPNTTGTGYVLLLSGIDMPATEGAGEMAIRPEFGATLTKLLNSRQPPASYIEMLLEAKATAGTGGGARVISYRLIDGPKPPA